MCPDLSDPVNGNIVFKVDTTAFFEFGTTATYVCNPGFGITGESPVRTCDGDHTSTTGAWTETAPTCDRRFMLI